MVSTGREVEAVRLAGVREGQCLGPGVQSGEGGVQGKGFPCSALHCTALGREEKVTGSVGHTRVWGRVWRQGRIPMLRVSATTLQ